MISISESPFVSVYDTVIYSSPAFRHIKKACPDKNFIGNSFHRVKVFILYFEYNHFSKRISVHLNFQYPGHSITFIIKGLKKCSG